MKPKRGQKRAASSMIAFLRQLLNLKPGEHILFDGFDAGTYYDVLTMALGSQASPAGARTIIIHNRRILSRMVEVWIRK